MSRLCGLIQSTMIKFVYFDVGGVVMRDFNKTNNWEKYKRAIGIKQEQDEKFDTYFDEKEWEVLRGLDIDTLIPEVNKKFGTSFSPGRSLLDDFVKLFARNPSIIPIIKEVRKTHPTGLLTNNYPGLLQKEFEIGLVPKGWDVVVDSSAVGEAKPDKEIFELAEKMSGFTGEEILFIEDGERNVEAASKFGWNTFLYDPSDCEKSSQELLVYFRKLQGES